MRCIYMQDVRRIRTVLFLIVFSILLGVPIRLGFAQEINLNGIKLPPGFEISVYASRIHGARSMALGNKGTLFVGSRSEGKVYAITDRNKDNKADEVITIASGLNSPNGVAFTDGSLYVAEISRILRFDDVENSLHNPPKPVVVNDSFPKEKHHG